mgnify:FL=1
MSNGIPEGKSAISSPLFVARIVCREKRLAAIWARLRPVLKCYPEVLVILFATGESYRLIRGVCYWLERIVGSSGVAFLIGRYGSGDGWFCGRTSPGRKGGSVHLCCER